MCTIRKRVVALYIDRNSQQWVVRDPEGKLWIVPYLENCWDQCVPFELTKETELELVPGHYRYVLGLPA